MFKHGHTSAAFVGLALALGGCFAPGEVGGDVLVDEATDALTASAVLSINGTYTTCSHRSGAWSVLVNASATLSNPALSVLLDDTGCQLSVTSIVADQVYTAGAAVPMGTAYQTNGALFVGASSGAFYGNAKLDAVTFASSFTITILSSNDPGEGTADVNTTRTGATMKWFGAGSFSQGAFDLTGTNRTSPVQESTATTTWNAIAAGGAVTCAKRTDGTLWCWGDNNNGQLGTGNLISQSSPTIVTGGSTTWTAVSTSGSHTCGIHSSSPGTLWCWGLNDQGQAGNGNLLDNPNPQTSPTQVSVGTNTFNSVTAGGAHTCAGRSDGTLWCLGSNVNGELGIGTTTSPQFSLQQVSGTTWRQASAGTVHTCAVKTDGTLWCWGGNSNGELGVGNTTSPQLSPVQVGSVTTWLSVAASPTGSHTCAVRTDHSLWCWGLNSSGQVGNSTTTNQTSPVQISPGNSWGSVALGTSHTCAKQSNFSTLFCWGLNDVGQDGVGSIGSPQTSPIQVGTLPTWSVPAAGGSHACGLKTDGTIWCWGGVDLGQLGIGVFSSTPATVQVGSATNWNRIAAGNSHTCATATDGTLWCWGANDHGQIGRGNTAGPQGTPLQVGSLTTWSAVAAGSSYSCATRTDGTLWCWGLNTSGQLGQGNTGQQTQTTQVGALTTWKTVATGDAHTCATKTDGTLWCWGANTSGQIGIGNTTSPQLSPVQVGGATTWSSVTAGALFTCATRTDGTLWCWGANAFGQLGTGDTTQQLSPVQAGTNTTWKLVSAGSGHACALRTDGTLWCWGYNGDGEVGQGNVTTPQASPVQVGASAAWNSLATGASHSCATRSDFSVWCWGLNTSGQVGTGNQTSPQTRPSLVPPFETTRRVYAGPMANNTFVGLCASCAAVSYRQTILAAGPVGYWPLDDAGNPPPTTIANLANAGSVGTPLGSAISYGLTGLITVGTSISFTNTASTTNRIEVAWDTINNPANDFSIEQWINVAGYTGDFMSPLTSRFAGTIRSGYNFYVQQTTNVMAFWVGNGNGFPKASGPVITPGVRYHIVGTYVKAGGLMTLYVNGVAYGNASAPNYTPTPSGTATSTLEIGVGGGLSFPFNGTIDETAVYDRVLTRAEVAQHYAAGIQ